jgi:hypothetical protein
MAELTARIRAALRHNFQIQGEVLTFVSGELYDSPEKDIGTSHLQSWTAIINFRPR